MTSRAAPQPAGAIGQILSFEIAPGWSRANRVADDYRTEVRPYFDGRAPPERFRLRVAYVWVRHNMRMSH